MEIDDFFPKSISSIKNGRDFIGWLCTYTPEEIIVAGGFTPYRMMGSLITNKSESFFPINFCPYLKSAWESLYTDRKNKLKAIVFTTSCDGMRRLIDTFRKYRPDIPAFVLDVPRKKDSASLDYFRETLCEFTRFIEELRGQNITQEELIRAIEIVNKKRILLKRLKEIYESYFPLIDASTYFKIMKISMTSELEIFVEELEKYIDFVCSNSFGNSCTTNNKSTINSWYNLGIIGNFINEDRLWEIFSDLNLKISFQDLCLSTRYFENLVEVASGKSPLQSISERYLKKPSCFREASLGQKLIETEKSIRANGIDGIIFITLKFCDNTMYFFPLLKKALLERLKIPSLYLEIEYQNFSAGQVKTRIQAFLEMLEQTR
ncbi:MAG: 2-hydroxyacyl-CoA dehydratase [Actinobacteria bacterium]|nr:2-hydroxyacyl-CoA dehydratase [Actinomycetota bacterium]